jgi:hypothetical protein
MYLFIYYSKNNYLRKSRQQRGTHIYIHAQYLGSLGGGGSVGTHGSYSAVRSSSVNSALERLMGGSPQPPCSGDIMALAIFVAHAHAALRNLTRSPAHFGLRHRICECINSQPGSLEFVARFQRVARDFFESVGVVEKERIRYGGIDAHAARVRVDTKQLGQVRCSQWRHGDSRLRNVFMNTRHGPHITYPTGQPKFGLSPHAS